MVAMRKVRQDPVIADDSTINRLARASCIADYSGVAACCHCAEDGDACPRHLARVRGVLTALRDPPKHILDAAEAQDDYTTKYVQAADAKTHWTAMIDAILAEGNG